MSENNDHVSDRKPARKPAPVRVEETAPFFDAAKDGQFMVQRCKQCGRHSFTGMKHCPHCLGKTSWVPASGQAKLHSYTIVHQTAHPAFAADIPYAVGTVQLQEGPMLVARLVGVDHAALCVGLPLKAHFIDNEDGEPTPVFSPEQNSN